MAVPAEDDKQMIDYFVERLSGKDDAPLLDMTFFSSYEHKIGFRYNVEALVNLDKPGSLFQVLSSITPPGAPYLEENKSLYASFPF